MNTPEESGRQEKHKEIYYDTEPEFQPEWAAESPEALEALLEDAIETALIEHLRRLLKELIRRYPAAKDLATERLTVSTSGSQKRKRKAYEMCSNCRTEYCVTINKPGCCIYHPGLNILY